MISVDKLSAVKSKLNGTRGQIFLRVGQVLDFSERVVWGAPGLDIRVRGGLFCPD